MEDAAVEFLLENLKQLQLHHSHLISDDAKNQIQVLETNLCLFKRFLNDSTDQNSDEDETLKQVIKQIVEVVYDAEDAVDAMVSQVVEKGVEKYFKRAFDARAELLRVVQQVESLGAKVKEMYDLKQVDFFTQETKHEYNTETEQKNLCYMGTEQKNLYNTRTEQKNLHEHKIVEVVSEPEEAVDAIVSLMAQKGVKKYFKRAFHDPAKLLSVVQQLGAMVKEISHMKRVDFALEAKHDYNMWMEQKNLHERKIVEVVSEAEDAADAMVSQMAQKGVKKYFKRAFDDPAKLLSVVQQLGAMIIEIYHMKRVDFALEAEHEYSVWMEQKNQHEHKIVEVVSEGEDAVHAMVRVKKDFKRAFDDPAKLLSVVQQLGAMIKEIYHMKRVDFAPEAKHEYNIWMEQKNQHERKIVEVVSEGEDAVDAMVSQMVQKGVKKDFRRAFDDPAKLLSVVQWAGAKVKEINDMKQVDFFALETKHEYDMWWMEQRNLHERKVLTRMKEGVYARDQEVRDLIDYLTEKTRELDVISIVGVAGLGKTTLAMLTFNRLEITDEFPDRLWVYISQDFRKRDVYLAMLRDLNYITEDMHDKADGEIAQTLRACLEREKFLIVFDDLWSTEAWDDLQDVLPRSNTMSKILITTRVHEVADYANPKRRPYTQRLLSSKECWVMLEHFAFPNGCYSSLRKLGISIATRCGGLPLCIKLLSGILAERGSEGEMYEIWEKVDKSLRTYDYREHSLQSVVSLSYSMLPCYLRPCFLYMGMFPEDYVIPVQKLILLWIAEGFIHQKTRIISLEETAMEYLKELINRRLVLSGKMSLTGRIKTCRMHDSIRDFCLNKGGEYFFPRNTRNSQALDFRVE